MKQREDRSGKQQVERGKTGDVRNTIAHPFEALMHR